MLYFVFNGLDSFNYTIQLLIIVPNPQIKKMVWLQTLLLRTEKLNLLSISFRKYILFELWKDSVNGLLWLVPVSLFVWQLLLYLFVVNKVWGGTQFVSLLSLFTWACLGYISWFIMLCSRGNIFHPTRIKDVLTAVKDGCFFRIGRWENLYDCIGYYQWKYL